MAESPLIPDVAPFPNLQTLLGKVRIDAASAASNAPGLQKEKKPQVGESSGMEGPFTSLSQIARHLNNPDLEDAAPACAAPAAAPASLPPPPPPAAQNALEAPIATATSGGAIFKEALATPPSAAEKPAASPIGKLPVLPVSKEMLLSLADIPNAVISRDAPAEPRQLPSFPVDLEPISELPVAAQMAFPEPDQWNETPPVTLSQEVIEPTHVEISPMLGLRADANALNESDPITLTAAASGDDDADGNTPILLQPAVIQNTSGWSMKVGGLLLAAASIALMVFTLLQWVEFWKVLAPRQPQTDWALANAKFWSVAAGSTAVGFMMLAFGSVRLRRWAQRITHAAGWMVIIFALVAFAVASAGYFFVVPQAQAGIPGFGKILSFGGVVVVVLPLLIISCFQSKNLPFLCATRDPKPRWTDHTPEPLLMLWLPCLALAAVLLGLAAMGGVFPFFGTFLSGSAGMAATVGSSLLLGISAWLLARKDGTGWWLALLCMGFLFGSAVWTFLHVPWGSFLSALGHHGTPLTTTSGASAVGISKLPSLLLLAAFAPLCLMFIMARGVIWPHPEEKES